MARLLSLATELHHMIAAYLSPRDHFRLSKCCHELWTVHAQGIHERRTLALKYGSCQLKYHNILPLLRTAISNDKVAVAIDAIYFEYMDGLPFNWIISDEIVAVVSGIMEDNRVLHKIAIEDTANGLDILKLVHSNLYDVVLTHLLYLSNNLRTFDYMAVGQDKYMMAFLQDTVRQYQAVVNLSPGRLPLENLTRISIDVGCVDNGYYNSLEWAWFFIQLPSLKEFQGIYMGDEGIPHDGHADFPHKSNVKSLSFRYCGMSPGWIETIIRNIQGLEEFRYAYYDRGIESNNHLLVKILRQFACTSLKTLMLLNSPDADPRACDDQTSLQVFERLTRLDCKVVDLLPKLYNKDVSKADVLISRLPRSLQTLWLRDICSDDIEPLLEFLQGDIHLLPNLHTVYTDPEDDVLRRECTKRGIQYEMPRTYEQWQWK